MSRWLSEKLGNYIVNCGQLLMTISEGRVNLKHTISQRNTQAIQDLLVGIYFLVHSRTYASVESAGTALLTDLYVKINKHVEGSVDENEGRL